MVKPTKLMSVHNIIFNRPFILCLVFDAAQNEFLPCILQRTELSSCALYISALSSLGNTAVPRRYDWERWSVRPDRFFPRKRDLTACSRSADYSHRPLAFMSSMYSSQLVESTTLEPESIKESTCSPSRAFTAASTAL